MFLLLKVTHPGLSPHSISGIRIDYNAYKTRISQGKPNLAAAAATTTPTVPENPPEFAQKEHSTFLDSTNEEPTLATTEPDANSERFPLSDPDPNTPATTPGETPDAPYPNSFAYIVELITTGQQIPGIKHIPNELNSAPPSEPVRAKRSKPWEKASGDNPSPSAGVAVREGGGGGSGGERKKGKISPRYRVSPAPYCLFCGAVARHE
ncbi:hypothetical protein C7212DRAFT_345808 [Tuber magnatum]|uniref:Peroxisomal membrane protein PEX14-like KPWE domain-containing protein n=1 Tax=Tuber magnatum TaxID=42249 RepID=A0A317SKA5_9PEZI|nr:hypothetical protein C7212DRAFT_345808 [Tuber magnatum]